MRHAIVIALFAFYACSNEGADDGGVPLPFDTQQMADTQSCTPQTLDSAGIQNCVDAVAGGPVSGVVELPAGLYYLTDTIVITDPYTIIRGRGRGATLITMMVADKAVFEFDSGVQAGGNELTGVYIYTFLQNNVGVYAHDQTEFLLRDVRIAMFGPGSVGLDLRTRDSVSVDNVTVFADRPVELGGAGNVAVFDHTNFNNCYFVELGLDSPIVWINPDTVVQDLTFTGYQAWVGGTYGLHWGPASAQRGKSNRIHIQNMRREQAAAGGASIYIERSAYDHLDHFICAACNFAYESDGLSLSGVYYPTVTSSTYDGAPGKKFATLGQDAIFYQQQNVVVERE